MQCGQLGHKDHGLVDADSVEDEARAEVAACVSRTTELVTTIDTVMVRFHAQQKQDKATLLRVKRKPSPTSTASTSHLTSAVGKSSPSG